MPKRIFSLLLSAIILLSASAISINAVQAESSEHTEANVITGQVEENGIVYYDEEGNEVDIAPLSNSVAVNGASLPEKYDLRDENRVTPVKNQGAEGLCWDFAATASFESSILSNDDLRSKLGSDPQKSLNLSEAGNAWYYHTDVADKSSDIYGQYRDEPSKGATGGDANLAAQSLASGFGAYPEQLLPYGNWSNGYDDDYRYYSDYRLKEFNVLPDDNIELIKQRVMENGAVAVRYNNHALNYCYSTDGMYSYFDNGNPIGEYSTMGHVVSIVGWDDNFSRENFNPEMQPDSNGAWLCKNSWGEENSSTAQGYEGYIWISYETAYLDFSQLIAQSSENLENIYQYEVCSLTSVNTDYAGNIFTARSDEELKQISFQSMGAVNATIEIYSLESGFTSPSDGKLLATEKYKNDLAGIYTVDVKEAVSLKKGDIFSVVIKSDEDMQLVVSGNVNTERKPNRSFIAFEGGLQDVSETWYYSYASIKAFTKNSVLDTSSLEAEINRAENLNFSEEITEEAKEKLFKELDNAKSVINSESKTQIEINNAAILLRHEINYISNYVYEINSVEDYNALADITLNSNKTASGIILINADLDFNNENIVPLFLKYAFSGRIEGNGHTIKNGVIDSTEYYGDYPHSGLFNRLENATVCDLTLNNIKSKGEAVQGVLIGTAENTEINNCRIVNSQAASAKQCAGLFMGDGFECAVRNSSVENCTVSGMNVASLIAGVDFGVSRENCTENNCKAQSFYLLQGIDEGYLSIENSGDMQYWSLLSYGNGEYTIEDYTGTLSSVRGDSISAEKKNGKYYVVKKEPYATAFCEYEYDDCGFAFVPSFENNGLILTRCFGGGENVTIPKTAYGKKITDFSDEIYIDNSDAIKSLTFDCDVKKIRGGFSYLPNLKSITFAGNIDVIGENAFQGCYSLESIDFGNSITTIMDHAFRGCESLSAIRIPENIRYIYQGAFIDCGAKSAVIEGGSLEYIGHNALGYTSRSIVTSNVSIPDFVLNASNTVAVQIYLEQCPVRYVNTDEYPPVIPEGLFDYGVFCKGDIDLNGRVDIGDVTQLQKYIANISELEPIALYNAYVLDYFDIDINNATAIQKYLAGFIDSLESSAAG